MELPLFYLSKLNICCLVTTPCLLDVCRCVDSQKRSFEIAQLRVVGTVTAPRDLSHLHASSVIVFRTFLSRKAHARALIETAPLFILRTWALAMAQNPTVHPYILRLLSFICRGARQGTRWCLSHTHFHSCIIGRTMLPKMGSLDGSWYIGILRSLAPCPRNLNLDCLCRQLSRISQQSSGYPSSTSHSITPMSLNLISGVTSSLTQRFGILELPRGSSLLTLPPCPLCAARGGILPGLVIVSLQANHYPSATPFIILTASSSIADAETCHI